ncbi:MAG TPA: CinA family protein [Hyphomicrobiaceae bacterium]|nr:CinA family protein [Hyphomicrobiaceae bacterium]
MTTVDLVEKARLTLDRCRSAGLKLATAESCTGGMIAGVLTEIAGSSDVVDCGFVTYSNAAKSRMLDVPPALLEQYGAVSEPVARAMADAALRRSGVDLTVAVTGVAGPGGGSAEKPVGLVHIAVSRRNGPTQHRRCLFENLDRHGVRTQTIATALDMLVAVIDAPAG